jgi:hypothetical protein
LRSATLYELDGGYDSLYRRLTDQRLIVKPDLGSVTPKPPRETLPALPSLERKQNFETLWHLPHRKNVFFTGREKVLADIRRALDRRGVAA